MITPTKRSLSISSKYVMLISALLVFRFEATRLIREMERKANTQINGCEEATRKTKWHIPILAMTADVIHATLDKCLKCGMDGYVSKPFQEKSLYQAVAKFFEPNPISNSDQVS